jgi:hypothetical protein
MFILLVIFSCLYGELVLEPILLEKDILDDSNLNTLEQYNCYDLDFLNENEYDYDYSDSMPEMYYNEIDLKVKNKKSLDI